MVEYAENGNLRDFLRERRPSDFLREQRPSDFFTSKQMQHNVEERSLFQALSIDELISFSLQIAKGMQFLAENHVSLN